jgi:hypothetical protein
MQKDTLLYSAGALNYESELEYDTNWYEYIRVWFLKLSCLTERPMEGPPLHLGVFYFLQRKTNKENQRMRSRCVWTSVFATNLSYRGYPTQGSISPDLPRSVCFVLINIINSKSFYSFYDSIWFYCFQQDSPSMYRGSNFIEHAVLPWCGLNATAHQQPRGTAAWSQHIGISSQFLTLDLRSIRTFLTFLYFSWSLLVFLDLLSQSWIQDPLLWKGRENMRKYKKIAFLDDTEPVV